MGRKDAIIKLRSLLLSRRTAIRAALRGDLSALQAIEKASGNLADSALDFAHEETSSQLAENGSRELRQIEEALVRFEGGDFGVCEDCEKPIPLARLQAVPFATLCIGCQVKLEKSGLSSWP